MFAFLKGKPPAFTTIDAAQYKAQFVNSGTPHTLVDVRTASEFRDGHIPGAINLPLDTLRLQTGSIPADQPIVVVCASGNRSRSGAQILTAVGLTNVYNLGGGTMRWKMQGNPVERG